MEDFAQKVLGVKPDIDAMLTLATQAGCSDLMVKVGSPAYFYRYGMMYQTRCVIDSRAWSIFQKKAISSEQNAKYVREKMMDFSYELGKYRYRASAGYSGGANICTFRMISEKLPSFESLGLSRDVQTLLNRAFAEKSGISMLVGATGSGKTSTLAACINSFSSVRGGSDLSFPLKDSHLITLEDPVEYIYPSKPSTRIVQKELGQDFRSFELGIKQALREHPTHILVGETRDRETIRALVEAARTGHSVLSTFHTSSVPDTIARLYSYLAAENMDVMYDLVSNMNFIMAQELIKGRKGYRLRYQYMFFNPAITKVLMKAISEGKNIPRTMGALLKNENLIKAKLVSDWVEAK